MSWIKRLALIAERYLGGLNKLTLAIVALIIGGVAFSVSYEVVMRYFFDNPTNWVPQVSKYCLVVIFFLPLAYAEQLGQHIKIDVLVLRLSKRTQTKLVIVTSALSIAAFVLFAWSGTLYAWQAFREGWDSGPPLHIRLFPILAMIPLGLFLLSLQISVTLVKHIIALTTRQQDNN